MHIRYFCYTFVLNKVIIFVYYKVRKNKPNKQNKMNTKKRELNDKLMERGALVLIVAYIAGSLVDMIEAGAGTLFVLWGVIYAGVCAYRGFRILTHNRK